MIKMLYIMTYHISSYQILAPKQMQEEKDVKKAAAVCLEVIGLDAELYRLGNTKARTVVPNPYRTDQILDALTVQ